MSPFIDLNQSQPNDRLFDLPPLSLRPEGLALDFKRYYASTCGRDKDCRSTYDPYLYLSVVRRDLLLDHWYVTR